MKEQKYLIPSFSEKGKYYLVTSTNGKYRCSCPHYIYRLRKIGGECKHISLVKSSPETVIQIELESLYCPMIKFLLNQDVKGIIGFDVDGTLEISAGIIKLDTLKKFKEKGWITGIVSNRVTSKKFSTKLRSLHLDFYERGGLGKKEIPMQKIASLYPELKPFYVGNTNFDKNDSEEANWTFIDARKVKMMNI